jgi:hypothetical protein
MGIETPTDKEDSAATQPVAEVEKPEEEQHVDVQNWIKCGWNFVLEQQLLEIFIFGLYLLSELYNGSNYFFPYI